MIKRFFVELSTTIKIVAAILCGLGAMWTVAYSVVHYVDSGYQCLAKVVILEEDYAAHKERFVTKINELERKVSDSDRDFRLTAAKLDTSLARISTDLQFIKEQLISRGMK